MAISAPRLDARAHNVSTTEAELVVDLVDGRRLVVPIAWFPRLLHASEDQLAKWELLGDGQGIHWPDIDEDISVHGLLHGFRDRAANAAQQADGG